MGHRAARRAVLASLAVAALALVLPAAARASMTTGNGGWVWQNPLPMSTTLNDVCFVDSLRGWAVGGYSQEVPLAAGTILATTDGGQTWTSEPVADNVDFYAVDFVDAQHGWAAGVGPNWQGVVYATNDGGATWLLRWADLVDWRQLSDITFVDPLHGWALASSAWGSSVVGEVLATSDGGRTWRTQWAGRCSSLGNLTFSDPSHGWVAAGSFLLRTSNAGATWTKVGLGKGAQVSAVAFADSEHGWAVGHGVLATTDGGSTWTREVSASTPLSDIAAVDPHHAWACGEGGGVIATTDGRTWTRLRPFEKAEWSPTAMSFGDASHGVMVGGEGPSNLLWTSDGGVTWNPAGSSAAASYDDGNAISFADESHGWVVGGSVLATSDGGATWSTQALPFAGDRYESLSDVSSVDAQHAWAVSNEGNVYATSDGTEWHRQVHFGPVAGNPVELNGVFFRDTSYGWVVGSADYERGLLYATTDGGASWHRQALSVQGVLADLCDVFFINRLQGWAVGGDNGPVIFATTDGGAHWHKQLSKTADSFLECVDFVDPLHGWASGYDPAIGASGGPLLFATSNGGVTWRKLSVRGVEEPISDIAFTDTNHGWMVGREGLVLVTEDGGRSWSRQDPGTGLDLYGIAAVDGQHAWIAGEGGTILATTTAGYSPAPVTVAHGAPAWTRLPAVVTLSAVDSPGGPGMIGGLAGTEYSIDGGSWTSGTTVTIPAPHNHTNDGLHIVNYRSCDAAGDLETPKAFCVAVDTLGPMTQTAAASGHTGRAVSLHYVVRDTLSPQATHIKLVIKSKSGRAVKVISLGSAVTGSWHLVRWKPRTSGVYRYCVYAKDLAGNSQSRVGTAAIVVR
jgi:photosystem II stability/assembly factor-like uncharacterized protein